MGIRRWWRACLAAGLVAGGGLDTWAAPAQPPAQAATPTLTALEQRWLQGVAPVLAFARSARLPLDVVVQPQPTPGLTPLGMAFVGGRCKLVLSMRGNALAQRLLDEITPALLDATLELIAAHELGHCQRHLAGSFARLPAGFADSPGLSADDEPAAAGETEAERRSGLSTVRDEEGYADLVGLAWTRQHHPALYDTLWTWLHRRRSADPVHDRAHDTRAWLLRVRDGEVLADPTLFGRASAVWAQALADDEPR